MVTEFGAIAYTGQVPQPSFLPPSLPLFPADPLPSFPRKRESRGGLPGIRHYKAVPFGIPAYAGMTVGGAAQFPVLYYLLSERPPSPPV